MARKIELTEKLNLLEAGMVDALNETEFTSGAGGVVDREFVEQYFMNRVRGKARYEDDDCI